MAFFDTNQQRAALLILLLAAGVLIALFPYASGLIGAPVLYVIFAPLHRVLARRLRPSLSGVLVILMAFLLIVLPGTWLIGMLVGRAQGVAQGIVTSPLLDRLQTLRVAQFDVGEQVATIGRELVSWLGGNALGFIGTATRFTLNLLFSFFGLYYLLLNPDGAWRSVLPYIPFSRQNAEALRDRFVAVTTGTVIGTGLTALIQGLLVGLAFWMAGLGNAPFWGVVTAVFGILPVVGSALIWGPGAISLALAGQTGWAVVVVLVGVLLVANVDYVIRPVVYRRYAQVHPLITLVGAVAGISYFGLLGLLIGPLALSYFFELIRMYRQEYLTHASWPGFTGEQPVPVPASAFPPPGSAPPEAG